MRIVYIIILYLFTFKCTSQIDALKADTNKINIKKRSMSLNPISIELLPLEGIEFKRNTSLQTTSVVENEDLEKKKAIEFQSEDGIDSKKNSSLPIKTSTEIIYSDNKQLLFEPK